MICYRGKAFCSQECANYKCDRNFNDNVLAQAIAWWGTDKPPIAFNDLKTDDCGYVEVVK